MNLLVRKKWMVIAAALGFGVVVTGVWMARVPRPECVAVAAGDLECWSLYDGYLESRNVMSVMSRLSGQAAIVDMVPDGSVVTQGQVLVALDAAQLERDVVRLSKEHVAAREELLSLQTARQPLEAEDFEMRRAEAWRQYSNELQTTADNETLYKEALISEREMAQQRDRTEWARLQAASLDKQKALTVGLLHPSARACAEASLAAAGEELGWANRQMSNSVVRATTAGMVAYKALNLGGEFRTVRVGDTIYRNQPFMTLSDMSDLIMRCDVPEADLTRIPPGAKAWIRPVAYPDLELAGVVESVGSMAQSVGGRTTGQKFFNVVIRLEENDARLKAGMSVQGRVLAAAATGVRLVPRQAVWWQGEQAYCRVWHWRRAQERAIVVGRGNDRSWEVVKGLEPGEQVVMP